MTSIISTFDSEWSYLLSVEESQRLPALCRPHTFADLANRIADKMTVLCCHYSKLSDGEFYRPVYTVQLERELFDCFFNSPNGYRAAYFQSPGTGLDANAYFMQAIAPRLIADQTSQNSELSETHLQESLSTPSAKVWLAEHGKEPERTCAGCKGEWSAPSAGPAEHFEITNGKWEAASGLKAQWGRKAPYLTKLRIMGAFINDRNHELVPFDKRFRACDIHQFGWS